MKLLHIIVGLNVGGAEMMLKRLIVHDPTSSQNCAVISLTTVGDIGHVLQAHGIQVHALNMSSFWHVPLGLWRLIRLIRQFNPAIVQTWMYHADLLGGLAARFAGNYPVVWNLRSNLIPTHRFSIPYWLICLCSVCSKFLPSHIICCARTAKNTHVHMGYPADKITVIPNGYDFSLLKKDLEARVHARTGLGFGESDIVFGVVGRFDPLKDFETFIAATKLVASKCATAKFLMVGRGNDWQNAALKTWIEQAGLADKFILVGQQDNVPYYLGAMDIFCLSSSNEAFSNVLVEAMAMGLPCVATDVGVANEVLSDSSYLVPIKQPAALADALLKISELDTTERCALGDANAAKVRIKYPIENISLAYEKIYAEFCNLRVENIKAKS
jgi:glycosyltransferase involved in cell wall biosynthesis